MATDWIKMRSDLYRDPKVIMMADILSDPRGPLGRFVMQHCQCEMSVTSNVTRNVTVGALVSIWGVARHQGERQGDDLLMKGADSDVVDGIADLPGIGAAMIAVGWLVETQEGLVFPMFFARHNHDPAESQREKNRDRQRRYKARKSNAFGNVTANVTKTLGNAQRERREENTYTPPRAGTSKPVPETANAEPDAFDAALIEFTGSPARINSVMSEQVRKFDLPIVQKALAMTKADGKGWKSAMALMQSLTFEDANERARATRKPRMSQQPDRAGRVDAPAGKYAKYSTKGKIGNAEPNSTGDVARAEIGQTF